MTDRGDAGQVGPVPGTQSTAEAAGRRLVLVRGASERVASPTFEALFASHYDFVCRTLRSLGIDPGSVEDVAQDVFLVLHRRLPEYDPARDVRSWLWGIARRALSTHQRGRQRGQRKLHALPEPDAARLPDEVLEQRRRVDAVAEALAELSDEHREVFVLVEIEELAAPEIAAAVGINVNTVYSRLRVARARFARAMQRRRLRDARQADARR